MISSSRIDYKDREQFYLKLERELDPLMERAWFTNLANASALLMMHLPNINWAGFYLSTGQELLLGPFQGQPACLKIRLGDGVCGLAARRRESVVVSDVHAFPGHIACDARSRSEIVIPLLHEERLLGVMDLDSPSLARFDDQDRLGLERIASTLVRRTSWPTDFIYF